MKSSAKLCETENMFGSYKRFLRPLTNKISEKSVFMKTFEHLWLWDVCPVLHLVPSFVISDSDVIH